MNLLPIRALFLLLAAGICSVCVDAAEQQTFLDPEQAFQPHLFIDGEQLKVDWSIEEGYFLYRHGFTVEVRIEEDSFAIPYHMQSGEKKYDDFFERNVETYHGSTALSANVRPYLGRNFQVNLTSQGCAEKGLCFPPTSYIFSIDSNGLISAELVATPLVSGIIEQTEKREASSIAPYIGFGEVVLTLLGALLGGLILNLMPCVFPVLSLKALSFASGHESKATLRAHGWAYTAGVVISFLAAATLILVARSAGQSLGWGFQLQHPVFIAFMVYLFFVMGLSLSGAFEFGGSFMGFGQQLTSGNTLKSSFFTGVLAALVASPCTAPFMATALGVALTQPAPVSLLIFATLAFGMALPFLALSYSPKLSKWMPRPGAWMEKFKQALSFPIYLTVIWLLWVLSHQADSETVILILTGMLLIVLSLWLLGFSPHERTHFFLRNALATVFFVPALFIAGNAAKSTHEDGGSEYEAYTSERLDYYRAQGKPVLVDLTADWCLTCKVNEKVAFTKYIRDQLEKHQIVVLVGDWTNKNAEITSLLIKHKRSGIPLYLMYPRGGGGPEMLPQLLTERILENAIERTVL